MLILSLILVELKEKLVTLRKKKGLSQLKLAEMIKVSRQAISRWEVGAAIPSMENLKFLGSLYDVPLDYLLNDNALEPVDEVQNTRKEEQVQTVSKRRKSIALVLVAIGLLGVILCTIFFIDKDKSPKKMDDIGGSEVVTEGIFKMEW